MLPIDRTRGLVERSGPAALVEKHDDPATGVHKYPIGEETTMDATSFTDLTKPISRFCSRRSFVKHAAAGALAAPLSQLGSPGAVARVTTPDQEATMVYAANREDGVRIAYTIEGQGPPLVLFHGSALSSDMWRVLGYVDALKERFKLILLDARGHGHSDKPHEEDAYAMRLLVGDIVAVLDHLGLEQAHFLGYSFGGRVGFGLGTSAPERVASLLIGGGSYRAVPGFMDRIAYPGALEIMASQGMQAFLVQWERHLGAPLPEGVRAAYLANDVEAMVPYFRRSDREPSVENALPQMTMPTLIFVGKHDTERFEDSHAAAGQLPDVTFAVIPGEDHRSTVLRRDAVVPRVTAFLERVTQQGA
jgi:pimeloyl-ACP methyl ester carboxylesterase